jgi:hypothetical protein
MMLVRQLNCHSNKAIVSFSINTGIIAHYRPLVRYAHRITEKNITKFICFTVVHRNILSMNYQRRSLSPRRCRPSTGDFQAEPGNQDINRKILIPVLL